jgi:Ion channel
MRSSEGPAYRYGVVFLLMLALVVFLIAAPEAEWSRALAILMAGVTLLVAITTARADRATRRSGEAIVGVVTLVVVVGDLVGFVPHSVSSAAGAVLTGAVPPVIVRGFLRLLRDRGVTRQAVAGALVIYLSLGLVGAWVISVVSQLSDTPYFNQHPTATLSDRVYFSFSTLTTTGFGDYTAATRVGKAIAVVEMLLGQLYLVTVIGVLVGSFVGRRRHDGPDTAER